MLEKIAFEYILYDYRAAQKRWEIKKEESQLTDFLRKVVEEVIDHKTKIQVSI